MSIQGTRVLFRTPPGGVTIPDETMVELTAAEYPKGVCVSPYPAIRIAVGNRASSELAATLLMMIACDGGVFATLDSFSLLPCGQYTLAYDVPGTRLKVFAQTPDRPGCAHVDFLLFGFAPYSL